MDDGRSGTLQTPRATVPRSGGVAARASDGVRGQYTTAWLPRQILNVRDGCDRVKLDLRGAGLIHARDCQLRSIAFQGTGFVQRNRTRIDRDSFNVTRHAHHDQRRRPAEITARRPVALRKKSLIFMHRSLGVSLCVLFLLWFISGIVMMYSDFPSVSAEEHLGRSPSLDVAMIRASRRITMAWTGQRGTLSERGIARRSRSIESPEWDSQSPSGLEANMYSNSY